MEIKKIGILTWYNHGNFGSALQAYATQTVLRKLGYDAEVIAYEMQWIRRSSKSIKKRMKRKIKTILAVLAEYSPLFIRFENHFQYFYFRYIRFSKTCDESTIAQICRKYDAIITGSDQIWSPAYIDYTYLLNFCTKKDVRKVAYAPSLGLNYMHDDKKEKYKHLLSDYDAISVREDTGAAILKELGFDSEVVLDPTLLLNADDYRQIEHAPQNIPSKFIFCYILPTENDYSKPVLDYAKKTNLPIIGISLNKGDEKWLNTIKNAGPSEFLWLIDHAEMVITNSYHGTILSMNLGTPFFCYERFRQGDPICQNSRIEQLNSQFGVDKYILCETDKIPSIRPYSIERFNSSIITLRNSSINYLSKSL